MPELDFILQAVTTASHAEAIRALLELPRPTQVLVSVAFVREPGLDAVEKTIKSIAAKARFFVGIRNDMTSIQAIKRLLAMNVEVYAVDTASRDTIFHPKLYFAANAKQASVIIGSANLTWGGLYNNIEASTLMKLDFSNAADRKFADQTTNAFAEMIRKHPRHVFLIKNGKHADELFESGRLADEEVIPAPPIMSQVKKGERDDLPPMKLNRATRPRVKIAVAASKPAPAASVAAAPGSTFVPSIPRSLVWESRALTERDLNIPSGTVTNPTGSMGLKKGALDGIDQRHYFRDTVFADLKWTADVHRPKWERAQAQFELVIKNLNYGLYTVRLSHNTDEKSTSYEQRNFMTQLHWGAAKKHIAKRDLLGRIVYLYRKDTSPPEFMLEID